MKKRIMITSLKDRKDRGEINYYYFNDGTKSMYIDALTSTEAGCKYILSNYNIDMIITFGSESTYDVGDDVKSMPLDEGKLFYAVDNNKMSSYSLLRYRLAEYLDDINAEMMDESEVLNPDEQKIAKKFVREFMNKTDSVNGKKRMNKFFNVLASDEELRKSFTAEIYTVSEKNKIDTDRFRKWVLHYLYKEYIEYGKMHLLDGNEDVAIRFLSSGVSEDNGLAFADLLIQNLSMISYFTDSDDVDEVELYLCLQDDNVKDTFVLTSLIEMIKSIPTSNVSVSKIVMTDSYSSNVALQIYDDTEKYFLSDLISGVKAFLKYGKTDMLLDYKENLGLKNSEIDGILYAMKNIDTGISLCDISDIERGIRSLRQYFAGQTRLKGNNFAEKYFNVIINAVKQDFGPLLTKEKIEFLDLVKWAYRKGFWQQTLTLIESRAPRDFIERGIYYYCDSEESKEDVINKFGLIYYNLKPFEKYKLDDVAHYYVKFYSRARVGRKDDSKAYQLEYAKARVEEIGLESDEIIKAFSLCSDKDALKDLLFSYYYLGDVRNATNHAQDEFSGFMSIMEDSDISERMNLIKHSVDYFIYCYEKVIGLIDDDEKVKDIHKIETADLVEFAKKYRFIAKEAAKNEKEAEVKDKTKPQKSRTRRKSNYADKKQAEGNEKSGNANKVEK